MRYRVVSGTFSVLKMSRLHSLCFCSKRKEVSTFASVKVASFCVLLSPVVFTYHLWRQIQCTLWACHLLFLYHSFCCILKLMKLLLQVPYLHFFMFSSSSPQLNSPTSVPCNILCHRNSSPTYCVNISKEF